MPFDPLKRVVFAVEVGCRHALLDAESVAWVCPHAHATAEDAQQCPENEGLLPERVPEGLTPEEVQDFLSIPRTEDELDEGDVVVWMPLAAAPRPLPGSRRRRAGGRREGRGIRGRWPRPARS